MPLDETGLFPILFPVVEIGQEKIVPFREIFHQCTYIYIYIYITHVYYYYYYYYCHCMALARPTNTQLERVY